MGHVAIAGLQRCQIVLYCWFEKMILFVKHSVLYMLDGMVDHRFNRTFPERPRWHMRISVYLGGIHSDASCSGKQRPRVFLWKEVGLFFSLEVGAGS